MNGTSTSPLTESSLSDRFKPREPPVADVDNNSDHSNPLCSKIAVRLGVLFVSLDTNFNQGYPSKRTQTRKLPST